MPAERTVFIDTPGLKRMVEHAAREWILDHLAETVALLTENGVLEQVAWRCEHVIPCAGPPTYQYRTYHPDHEGHVDDKRLYRVSLPTKGDEQ